MVINIFNDIQAVTIYIAAIESGYISNIDWQQWAEQQMLRADSVPSWLIDLYDANTPEEAISALNSYWCRLSESSSYNHQQLEFNLVDLLLGFIYLRFKRGDIDMSRLLSEAGRIADGQNYSNPSCEDFYLLLNEIDRGGPIMPSIIPLIERVEELFSPKAKIARRCLFYLKPQ